MLQTQKYDCLTKTVKIDDEMRRKNCMYIVYDKHRFKGRCLTIQWIRSRAEYEELRLGSTTENIDIHAEE